MNSDYEEAVNANVNRAISGITNPPPPEENLDAELNNLNSQKQKAFESIKTILSKHDESVKFLNKLDDSEILPFNSYFTKFKSDTVGLNVKDADFLIGLWDKFKKKIILNDKETPILGTDLENYKRELQTKADDIVEYAAELGLNANRVKEVLDRMVNESDSAAVDKFYYNLLTKGIPAAKMILAEDFKAEAPSVPAPILTEEVLPEAARIDYEKKLKKLYDGRLKTANALQGLLVRDINYEPVIKLGVKDITIRKLNPAINSDKNIIINHLPPTVRIMKEQNKQMNNYLRLLGSDNRVPADEYLRDFKVDEQTRQLLPNLDLSVPVEVEEIKEVIPVEVEKNILLKPESIKFDFNLISDDEFNSLIEVMDADGKKVYNEIIRRHPDGKFELNRVKYNMNRNPPLLEKQKEYILKPFYDKYGINISPVELFRKLKESDRYIEYEREKQSELEQKEVRQTLMSEIIKKKEELDTKKMNKAEKKEYLDELKKNSELIANEAYTLSQNIENRTLKPIINNIKDKVYEVAKETGFDDFKLSNEQIFDAIKGNINESVINLMRLIVEPIEPDLDRIDTVEGIQKKLLVQRDNLINNLEYAKGRNASKMRNQLSEINAEIATNEDFLNKNYKLYEKVNMLQNNLKPFSELLREIYAVKIDDLSRDRKELEINMKPLEDRYEQISNKLHDEGIDIPILTEAMKKIEIANRGPKEKIKKQKNIINVPKQKAIKYNIPPKPMNKAQRRILDEIEEEEKLLNYDGNYQDVDEKGVPFERDYDRRGRYGSNKVEFRNYIPYIAKQKVGKKKAKEVITIKPKSQEQYVDENFRGGELVKQNKRRDKLSKIKFGKYSISEKALGSGILDIRTGCNRTSSKLGRTPISSKLEKSISYVIKNNDIDIDLFEDLSPEEKKLFLYAIEISEVKLNSIPFDVFKKFNSTDMNKELDNLIDRYHILVGELGAGNNAPEILRELRGILFKLLEKKKVDKVYANELLLMINSVA